MRKLITALVATLTILLAGSIVGKAEAAPRPMFPLTQSYTPTEKVAYYHRYARRHYRRGYGYGYGYGSPPILWLWLPPTLLWLRLPTRLRLALLEPQRADSCGPNGKTLPEG